MLDDAVRSLAATRGDFEEDLKETRSGGLLLDESIELWFPFEIE
jgi:hypothetical protein